MSKSARKRTKDKDKQKLGGQRSTSDSDLAGSIAQALAQSSSTPNFHVRMRACSHVFHLLNYVELQCLGDLLLRLISAVGFPPWL